MRNDYRSTENKTHYQMIPHSLYVMSSFLLLESIHSYSLARYTPYKKLSHIFCDMKTPVGNDR